jgi:GntR family transcriptional regulator, rspAB operon transcriptional repressor
MEDANAYAFLVRPEHLPRGSLAGQVADQLRRAIVNLDLKPGTMLDKSIIGEKLGVSRSPISDAIAQLQGEGLVEVLPQRGSIVSLVSVAAVEEYIFVRKALEGAVVKKLASAPPENLIVELETNLKAQRQSVADDDRAGFHVLDLRFHELLLSAIPYRRMKAMVDTARNNLDRARRLTNSSRRIGTGITEHISVLEAIKTGDGLAAANRMEMHLDGMVTELYGLAQERPGLFADGEIAEQRLRRV